MIDISYYGHIETNIEKIMEILTPIDMKSKVQKIKEIADALRNELVAGVECLVPKGYTLQVSDSFTYVYKTPEDQSISHVGYSNYLIMTHHKSSGFLTEKTKCDINLCHKITSDDVYRLNGLIQMLVVDNLADLAGITIVGKS